MTSIPEGFELLETRSSFSNHVGPLYTQRLAGEVVFGLLVQAHHCNSGGVMHGGMVNTLADLAIGNNIGLILAERAATSEGNQNAAAAGSASLPSRVGGAPIATVSMATDFAGSARLGEWVEVKVDVQRVGASMAFANAYLVANGKRFARSSAVFKVVA